MASAPAHGDAPASPPFAHLAPGLALAAAYGVATLVWALAGDALPGGRWLAVQLFTLGVVSNLVLALTVHFSATITHAPTDGATGLRLAVPALRTAAVALLVGVAALGLGGAAGAAGRLADVVAVLALAGYALAATAVCAPVVQVAYRTDRYAHGLLLAASCVWFPAATWAGVVALASGRAALLDGVGLVLLVGVLAQAVLGSWGYLLPMAIGAGPTARARAPTPDPTGSGPAGCAQPRGRTPRPRSATGSWSRADHAAGDHGLDAHRRRDRPHAHHGGERPARRAT